MTKLIKTFESFIQQKDIPIKFITTTSIYYDTYLNSWDRSNNSSKDIEIDRHNVVVFLRQEGDILFYTDDDGLTHEFTIEDLIYLNKSDLIELIYEVPKDIINFCEELLIDMIDKGYTLYFSYSAKIGVKSLRLQLFASKGEDMSSKKCLDTLLSFVDIFTDEYEIKSFDYNYKYGLSINDIKNIVTDTDVSIISFLINIDK